MGAFKGVVFLVFAAMTLEGFDLTLISFVAPIASKEWGLSKIDFAPAMAAALMGMAVGALLGGLQTDLFGRRRTLIGNTMIFGAATLLCALARDVGDLVVLRAIAGLGFGAIWPACTALLAECLPRKLLGKAMAYLSIAIPTGGIAAAWTSSWLLPAYGWRSSFIAAGLITVLVVVLLVMKLPESPDFKTGGSAVGSALARFFARLRGTVQPTATPAAADHGSAEHAPAPKGGNARLNAGILSSFFINGLALFMVINWLPTVITEMGADSSDAARATSLYYVSGIVLVYITGAVLNRLGSNVVVVGASVFACVSFTGLFLLNTKLKTAPDLLLVLVTAGLVIVGALIGVIQTVINAVTAQAYPAQSRGTAVGLASTMGRLGAISSSFLAALILTRGGVSGFLVCMAALMALIIPANALINRHIAARAHSDE